MFAASAIEQVAFMWCYVEVMMAVLGPVSLRLMTSQFKDIVNHTQK